ncbi:MAG: NADH-quinone oxidoreductase subunit M [Microscillaceae bacterium]|jgi:NADH-quinone oxidoreductase subunit M|nr:NADH-quinone oxidoreductase subunit M [Microscillaceae bacterium]
MQNYLLSILIFLPLGAMVGILCLPNSQKKTFKIITLLVTGLQLLVSLVIYATYAVSKGSPAGVYHTSGFQFAERVEWIRLDLGNLGQLSIDYWLGVDGLNVMLVVLTGLVMFVGAIASWQIQTKVKGYFALYLLLSSSLMGCFVALDFFLFYLFFEFMLLPMYFLIGIWGGERREYASIKFFIYTLFGSLLILIAMIALYLSVIDPHKTARQAGLAEKSQVIDNQILTKTQDKLAEGTLPANNRVHTFGLPMMMDKANYLPNASLQPNSGSETWTMRALIFWALLLGFAIKLPIVPFHTWLPDAHVEAPTPVSVVLAGVLLKIGGYGILRIAYSIFPDMAIEYASWVASLGVLAIIYGALNALAMADLKKMVAYSSVSHMGFVLLGVASLTAEGVNGAIFQMFSHGILSAMLFIIVGVLYDRTHDRQIEHYRGLSQAMPYFTGLVMIAFFASLGLPGFSGFIGEVFTLLGSFKSTKIAIGISVVAVGGIVLGAAYFLWTLQRMFLGKFWVKDAQWKTQLHDLYPAEWLMLGGLAAATLVFGLFPSLVFNLTSQSVEVFLGLFVK